MWHTRPTEFISVGTSIRGVTSEFFLNSQSHFFFLCVLYWTDPRVQEWLLVYSPWPTVVLCMTYLLMCVIGPKIMARREGYQLKGVIMIYNLCMVGYSFYVTVEVSGL